MAKKRHRADWCGFVPVKVVEGLHGGGVAVLGDRADPDLVGELVALGGLGLLDHVGAEGVDGQTFFKVEVVARHLGTNITKIDVADAVAIVLGLEDPLALVINRTSKKLKL